MWALKLDDCEMKSQFSHYHISELKQLVPSELLFIHFDDWNTILFTHYIFKILPCSCNTVNSGTASMNKTKTLPYSGRVN